MMDEELIEQFRHGKADAFSEIVRRHVDWVYSAARRRVRDAHLAEDITQAVFIALSRKIPHAKNGSLSPWLFAVLIRISRDAIKREAIRQRHESEAAKMRPTTTPDPQADWNSIAPNLEEAVARLRYADQQAILLRFYEQLSFAEVAETLGITEEAARKRVSRATEKLRLRLAPLDLDLSTTSLTAILFQGAATSAPKVVAEVISQSLADTRPAISALVESGKTALIERTLKNPTAVLCSLAVVIGGIALIVSRIATGQVSSPVAPGFKPPATTTAAGADVDQLYARYKASADWKKTIAMKVSAEYETRNPPDQPLVRKYEFFYYRDGNREEAIGQSTISVPDGMRVDPICQILSDRYEFRSEGIITPTRWSISTYFTARNGQSLQHLENPGGFLDADAAKEQSVAAELIGSGAHVFRLQDVDEHINGIACKVLKGQVEGVEIKLWIAPALGYNAVKSFVTWDAPDQLRGKTLDEMGITRITSERDDIIVDQIANVFIPRSGRETVVTQYKDGRHDTTVTRVRRSDIQLHPDLEKLQAFTVQLLPGTIVKSEEPGIYYQWRTDAAVPVDQLADFLGPKIDADDPPELPVPTGSTR